MPAIVCDSAIAARDIAVLVVGRFDKYKPHMTQQSPSPPRQSTRAQELKSRVVGRRQACLWMSVHDEHFIKNEASDSLHIEGRLGVTGKGGHHH